MSDWEPGEAAQAIDFHPGRPIEALDIHYYLWSHAGDALRLDLYQSIVGTPEAYEMGYRGGASAEWYAQREAEALDKATTVFVTQEMMQDVVGRAEAYEGAALREEDLPIETGLVVFAEPLPYPDYDINVVKEKGPEALPMLDLRAVLWGPSDVTTGEEGQALNGIAFWLYIDIPRRFRARYGQNLILVDFSGWAYGVPWKPGPWDVLSVKNIRPHMALARQWLYSLFMFMNEELISIRAPRQQRRLIERKWKKLPEDGDVKVVHLRRYASMPAQKPSANGDEDQEQREIEWSCRWWVRGHWHTYHTKTGPEQRWVAAYVKGPEDRPLVLKETVLSLDR